MTNYEKVSVGNNSNSDEFHDNSTKVEEVDEISCQIVEKTSSIHYGDNLKQKIEKEHTIAVESTRTKNIFNHQDNTNTTLYPDIKDMHLVDITAKSVVFKNNTTTAEKKNIITKNHYNTTEQNKKIMDSLQAIKKKRLSFSSSPSSPSKQPGIDLSFK